MTMTEKDVIHETVATHRFEVVTSFDVQAIDDAVSFCSTDSGDLYVTRTHGQVNFYRQPLEWKRTRIRA